MAIETRTVTRIMHWLQCDNCPNCTKPSANLAGLRFDAESRGWMIDETWNGLTHVKTVTCPDCT